jgi:hypothetical protein
MAGSAGSLEARIVMPRIALALPIAAFAIAAPAARAADTVSLRLVCEGVNSQAAEIDYHPRLSHEGGPAAGSGTGLAPLPTSKAERRLRVEINGASGRVRLPAAMAHESHDDWVAISALSVGDEEITGHFSTGMFRTERLRIDRTSGEITLRGTSAYDGVCDKDSGVPPPRKF